MSKRLAAAYPGVYNETNVCISGIHTHSGPGGFHQYVLLDVTSLGFVKQSTDALIEGIFQVTDLFIARLILLVSCDFVTIVLCISTCRV